MLAGGFIMIAWGGSIMKIRDMFLFSILMVTFIGLVGLRESIPMICMSFCLAMFFLQFSNACSQVVWQSKVELFIHGRIFALRQMVKMALMPVAYLLSGPILEKVFNPFVDHQGWIRAIIGNGEARGIGLLILTIGLLWIINCLFLYGNQSVRNLDLEVPDPLIQEVSLS